jgi:hypothetical protein
MDANTAVYTSIEEVARVEIPTYIKMRTQAHLTYSVVFIS